MSNQIPPTLLSEKALKESEERYKTVFEKGLSAIVVAKDNGDYITVNQAAAELFGYETDELLQMNVGDLMTIIKPGAAERYKRYLEKGEETGEFEFVTKKGKHKVAIYRATRIKDDFNLSMLFDITERKQAEEKIQTAREFLNQVIDFSMFGMWISDKEGTVIRANRSFCETINSTEDKIVGKYNVFKDDNLKIQGVMPKVKAVFENYQPARFTISWQAARVREVDFQATRDIYVDVYIFPIMDTHGKLKNVVWQWLDISELKKVEKQLREMIEFDSLTQVYSRQHLLGLAERMFIRIKQEQSSLLCMMFDIDHFKSINDTYGHKVGDTALIAFSEIIFKNFGSNDLFGRIGGEEFLAIVPDISLEAGKKLAERIRIEVEQTPIMTDAGWITMTVSVGVSIYEKTKDLATFDELMELSDKALYVAKNSGRNRVYVDKTITYASKGRVKGALH